MKRKLANLNCKIRKKTIFEETQIKKTKTNSFTQTLSLEDQIIINELDNIFPLGAVKMSIVKI